MIFGHIIIFYISPINNIQIHDEQDYILACSTLEHFKPIDHVLPKSICNILGALFSQHGINNQVTIVSRKDPNKNIPKTTQ